MFCGHFPLKEISSFDWHFSFAGFTQKRLKKYQIEQNYNNSLCKIPLSCAGVGYFLGETAGGKTTKKERGRRRRRLESYFHGKPRNVDGLGGFLSGESWYGETTKKIGKTQTLFDYSSQH